MSNLDTNTQRGRDAFELEMEACDLLRWYNGYHCQHLDKEGGSQLGNIIVDASGKYRGLVALRTRDLTLERLQSPEFDNRIMLTKEKYDKRFKLVANWMRCELFGMFYLHADDPRTLLFISLYDPRNPLRDWPHFKSAKMWMQKNINSPEEKLEDVYLIDMSKAEIVQRLPVTPFSRVRKI